jgi:hypothetical protein
MRPSFAEILEALDKIMHSTFTKTPHESFHTMQDNWRVEIEDVLTGLRKKETVLILISSKGQAKFTLSLTLTSTSAFLVQFLFTHDSICLVLA